MRKNLVLIFCGLLGVSSISLAVGDEWVRKADMPTARLDLSTVAVNGKVYAIGGTSRANGKPLSTVEEYDPSTNKQKNLCYWWGNATIPGCFYADDTRIRPRSGYVGAQDRYANSQGNIIYQHSQREDICYWGNESPHFGWAFDCGRIHPAFLRLSTGQTGDDVG